MLDIANGQVGLNSSRVNRVTSKKQVILSKLKNGLVQSGCGSGRVGLGRVDLYFSHEFFFFKENIYLPFGKSRSKLLDVKCIILNSPFISRMNSAKQINTCSINIKLYKSQHY